MALDLNSVGRTDSTPPDALTEGQRRTGSSSKSSRDAAPQRTILVVEDDPVMRLVTDKILQNAGFRVRQAVDGIEAIEIFRRDVQAFEAVILDIVMPRLNGRETFAILRRLRPDLPVLVISGQPQDLALEGMEGAEHLRFIGKPFRPKELLRDFAALLRAALSPT